MRSLKGLTSKRWASFAFTSALFLATLTGIAPAEAATCSPSSAANTSNSAIIVLTFTTVTTCDWQVPAGVSEISLVVVGGGGGGGGDAAGGGGAGGMYLNTNYLVTPGNTISVKVGAGGAGGQCSPGNAGSCSGGYVAPQNGSDSFFGVISTPGGGKGGVYNNGSGGNGGSGGGGGGPSGTGGSKTVSGANYFGNNGGTGNGSAGGAGGGGAGAVGTSTSPGAGGDGKATTITGTQIYLAGGGGGGSSGGQVSGGLGGGGAGAHSCGANAFASASNPLSAQSGATSTGGGGGGAPWGCPGSGGDGGSGIVILSYLQNVATTISLALASSLRSANYRTASTIEATATGANGKVRFMQNGKAIPGCAAIQSISLIARCNWKPSNRGSVALTARLTPTSAGFQISNSSILNISISPRTTSR
jgi:hypothetical protein